MTFSSDQNSTEMQMMLEDHMIKKTKFNKIIVKCGSNKCKSVKNTLK